MRTMAVALIATATLLLARGGTAAEPHWTPGLWVDEDTVELRTTRGDEGPHWFKVWVAVVDDQLYARLGRRAADRIEHNTTAPEVAVRIAGQRNDGAPPAKGTPPGRRVSRARAWSRPASRARRRPTVACR